MGRGRLSALMGTLCGAAALAGAASAAPPPAAPKLVVALSVDQFSLELYQRYRPTFTGGFKRLSQGRAFTGYQSHAATETCPGHSAILTGDHPARTGIVANDWYDRASRATVYCVQAAGPNDADARGPGRLRVEALGDWLNRARPGSRTVSVSGKDRAAIMMAGQHPDAVYWWKDREGFVTSSYAGPTTAEVLAPARAFNAAVIDGWRKRPPQLWPTRIPDRCAALQKPYTFGRLALSGRVPPEAARAAEQDGLAGARFAGELRASPIFDPLTLAFAERLVEADRLGRGPATDLLAVSLSSTDVIDHRYGNGGAEACVQLAALDRALGRFFGSLDRLGVPYVVVLTADHGAIDAPERLGPPARRIDAAALMGALRDHLRTAFGLGYNPLAGGDAREIVLELASADEPRRGEIVGDALAWLRARPEVSAAFSADEVVRAAPPPGKPAPDLSLAERFHESFDRERSGDIMVAYAEGATLGVPSKPGDSVASHGSPWDYDRRVPILWWWPGVAGRTEPQPMETVDIAPTLAAMIGFSPPPVDGRCVDLGQGCAP